ncbi:hypothetical protein NA57DRAFT_77101 [Rhizodiscina lignyota]|uniref:Mediator of RNA polymerase II transcription subunit 13 n=1 Tax=Rhizodiscina lignyota TaxID=1504668 RepID=A0A9P4IH04_9PEZI|nr:hypothetical protein NA57DRAFT_77101 [Rhizodiscina lignyota]
MEFLKSCTTGVHSVGGYSTVLYRIFTAQPDDNATATADEPLAREYDAVDTVQSNLSHQGHLVVGDSGSACIWLFQNQWNGQPVQEVPKDAKLPVVEGFTFQSVTQGIFKVSDLPRARFRAATGAKSPLTPPLTVSSGILRTWVANAKAFQGNAAVSDGSSSQTVAPELDPLAVYSWFISAVEGSVARHLASTGGLVPLNGRSFVTTDSSRTSYQSPSEDEDAPEVLQIVSLSTYVTTSGVLVLSFSSVPRPDIRCLHPNSRSDSYVSRLVRLSPSGVLAKYMSATTDRNDHGAASQKRLRAGTNAFSDLKWKTSVKDWLARRSIDLETIDPGDSWVEVQLSQDVWAERGSFDESQAPKPGVLRCLWPAVLCFHYSGSLSDPLKRMRVSPSEGLRWFQGDGQDRYADPLADAQEWFLNKPERDKAREAKKQAQSTNQEQVSLQDTNLLYPASPFYSRADLQSASGVYPTPPDAILTQASASGVSSDGLTVTSGHELQRTSSDNLELIVPEVVKQVGGAKGAASPLDNDNELFGDMDMDEDNFGGNELSEADFNFFDEPDADDDALLDAGAEMDIVDSEPVDPEQSLTEQRDMQMDITTDQEPTGVKREDAHTADISSDAVAMIPTSPPTIADQNEQSGAHKSEPDNLQNIAETPHQEPLASPPISPVVSRKQLVSSRSAFDEVPTAKVINDKLAQSDSMYDTVSFNRTFNATDSKYAVGGVFGFTPSESGHSVLRAKPSKNRSSIDQGVMTEPKMLDSSRPTAVFYQSESSRPQASKRDPQQKVSLTDVGRMEIVEDSDTEDTSTVMSSEDIAVWDEETNMKEEPEISSRKRPRIDDGTSTVSTPRSGSSDERLPKIDELALNVKETEVLSIFDPDSADWDLSRLPAPKIGQNIGGKPNAQPITSSAPAQTPQSSQDVAAMKLQGLQGRAIIAIAQMLVDQVASTVLQMLPEPSGTPAQWDGSFGNDITRPPVLPQNLLVDTFPGIGPNDLVKYSQVQDAPFEPPPGSKNQPKQQQRKTAVGPDAAIPSNTIFPLHPQHVRLRRGDSLWDLLPTALAFWEPLGLAPANGPKNVMAFCVYPSNQDLVEPISSFLDSLGAAYDSCKLGAHVRGSDLGDFEAGLVPVEVSGTDRPTREYAVKTVRETCVELGKLLAKADLVPAEKALQESAQTKADEDAPKIGAFVVYIVNPFEDATSLRDICACFWALFQTYDQSCRAQSPLDRKPDLVLQIIPIKYVASIDAPVVPSPQLLAALAREVYDRCPPTSTTDNSSLCIRTAPSVQLEETLPRSIHFKLTAEPPGDLLHDCSHIHIGYAMDWDSDWLTVAWTDNCGKYQNLLSYSLRGARSFTDAAREVWQTTLAIIQVRKVTWRISIARAGIMHKDEMEAWASIVTSPSSVPIGTVLISINPDPPLSLMPPATQPTQNANNLTPVSTPQGVSPSDPSAGAAATPSEVAQDAANDPDAHLIDTTDETWGVVMGHRLNNSHSLTEWRPSLASGFLIKRGGDGSSSRDDEGNVQGPIAVGVNIVWIGSSIRAQGLNAQQNQSQAQNQNQTPSSSQGAAVTPGTPFPPGGIPATSQAQQQAGSTSAAAAAAIGGMRGGPSIDPLLREYLHIYRGLGLLAKLRGMKGTKGGAVPWHIVAAVNGVKGLERCM